MVKFYPFSYYIAQVELFLLLQSINITCGAYVRLGMTLSILLSLFNVILEIETLKQKL